MPEDIAAALERFQVFLGRFGSDAVIDPESGFTAADGNLLAGELDLLESRRGHEAPIAYE